MKPTVSADRIRVALSEARPAVLSFKQLVAATELSPSQTRRGLGILRDIAAQDHLPPLIWTLADGYRFSGDPVELEAYEQAIFKRKLNEFARLITDTIGPHAELDPEDEWVQLVLAQLNGIRAALDMLVRFRRGGTARVGR
ncbi:RacP protein [Streptomyces sp. ISL-10]|uniref:RacP protein n=1 Tax=Streptomyces sp. ISL-10 TaxID=2819172 RepID=UPI001BE752A5|nr:RacP protein [Streptomyces sp. ISL-10]MBT2370411.1 RacP protein [Streptomyces sp. ISL-10]